MPTMPDAEAGHILTNLYGAGISGHSRPPPPSEFPLPKPPQHQQQHQHQHPPPTAQFTPVALSTAEPSDRSLPTFTSGAEPPKAHDFPTPAKRSRSRPTKSCEQCRRKKLKCNRELPCSQCLKGGRDGRLCHFEYGPEAGDRNHGRDEEMERGLKRFRVDVEEPRREILQTISPRDDRLSVENLAPSYPPRTETYSSEHKPLIPGRPQGFFSNYATYPTPESAPGAGPSHTSLSADSQTRYPTATLGRIHVKGGGSRFMGRHDRMAMLHYFKDVKKFIFGSFKDPEMSGMFQELFAFKKALYPKHGYCTSEVDLPADRDSLREEMLRSVPPENQLANLQEGYVVTWETISRVLHIPTFAKVCAAIAEEKSTGQETLPQHVRDWGLAQVICVTAIASRLYDPSNKEATAEKRSEEQISKDIAMVQKWLDGVHGRGQMNIHVLETRVLLLIAHYANLGNPSELWRECGDVVRRAMVIGLHQDPESSDRMPMFQKEMRRKLWMSIVEMDIRFSLMAGMPTSISSSLINIVEIINVDDEELNEDMQEYPMHKPHTVWTHALPQIALAASVKERLDVTNLLGGNINIERDAPLILHHAQALEKSLRSLPTLFRSSTKTGNNSNKRIHRLFTSIMLDVSIRRPLLSLYQSVALSSVSSQYPEAMTGALRNSLAILAHLDALDPTVADLSTVKTSDYLNLFHILCKSDINQAAMILCYQIRSFNNTSKSPESPEEDAGDEQDHFHEGQTKQSLTRVVENTLKSIIQRIGDFGSDLKEVLPLSVLLQAVRADGTDEEKKQMMIKGAERVLLVCRQIQPSIQDAVNQNGTGFDKFHHGHSPDRDHSHHPATPNWNPPPVNNLEPALNGAMPAFDDFNLMPGDDFHLQSFDLGFIDWDMNQSWL